MLSEIIQQRKITNKSITCTQNKISSIGRSPHYQNIQCLYLTGNKLRSLAGIEQFIFLKTLQVSNNLIDSINEIYRVFNPSLLQILGCADNPFSENPCHTTLILQKFISLQQIDDIKLGFDRRQYFNWIDECERLIIPAFHQIINQKVSGEIFQITIQLKQILKKYDPSMEAVNQLFHLMLCKIIQTMDETDDISQEIQTTLLWEILGYQEKNKHKKLKKFLVVKSLEDQNNDLFLFAQNEEYACEAITKAFIQLSQTQESSSFPYFPFNKPFIFALIEVFLKQIKYDQPKKISVPEMTIARKDLSRLLSKPNESTMEKTQTKVNFQESYEINFGRSDDKLQDKSLTQEKSQTQDQFFQNQSFNRNQSLNMEGSFNYDKSDKKSIPIEDKSEYFLQQIKKSKKEILNIRLAKSRSVLENLNFLETRIQQTNLDAFKHLFTFSTIKHQFNSKLITLTERLEKTFKAQQLQCQRLVIQTLVRKNRFSQASNRLDEFLTFAQKIDKRNILYTLQDQANTFHFKREQYLKQKIFSFLIKRTALSRIIDKYDRFITNKKLSTLLRWKIISNNLKYAEQRLIGQALRNTQGLDSTSTIPKQRIQGETDLLKYPLTLRDDRFIGPITIENATIICKNTDKKKKKKKKKRVATESSKSKSTSHSHICSKKQFYCDICQTLMSKLS